MKRNETCGTHHQLSESEQKYHTYRWCDLSFLRWWRSLCPEDIYFHSCVEITTTTLYYTLSTGPHQYVHTWNTRHSQAVSPVDGDDSALRGRWHIQPGAVHWQYVVLQARIVPGCHVKHPLPINLPAHREKNKMQMTLMTVSVRCDQTLFLSRIKLSLIAWLEKKRCENVLHYCFTLLWLQTWHLASPKTWINPEVGESLSLS